MSNDLRKRVYVASRFTNYERVRAFADRLRDLGYVVSYDWTLTDEFGDDGEMLTSGDLEVDKSKLARYAALDRAGVVQADAVVQLAEPEGMKGAHWECGMAAALRTPVVVVAPTDYVIFHELPDVVVADDEDDAVDILRYMFDPVDDRRYATEGLDRL